MIAMNIITSMRNDPKTLFDVFFYRCFPFLSFRQRSFFIFFELANNNDNNNDNDNGMDAIHSSIGIYWQFMNNIYL